jgi:hypothetical protein
MTRKTSRAFPFALGVVAGTLLALAWVLLTPAKPYAAIGYTACGQFVGLVLVWDDGRTEALVPFAAEPEEVERVMALVADLPPEMKGLIEVPMACRVGS